MLNGRGFWFRSLAATGIGEFIDTFIANVTAFFGIFSMLKIMELIMITFFVKIMWNSIYTIPLSLIVQYLKSWLKLDVFSYSEKFNPFAVSVSS